MFHPLERSSGSNCKVLGSSSVYQEPWACLMINNANTRKVVCKLPKQGLQPAQTDEKIKIKGSQLI
ncbi:MAG: hypothetical protein DWH88_04530 [Planctomycetota bacterium]|nr:MAG: hypothetical protein DWH88_04530 [Planctomycetota bacterium]